MRFRAHALVLVAGTSVLASCAPVARTIAGISRSAVPESYWGMHVHQAVTAWPEVTFGNWRLWDADVAWPQLEPRKGEWHFDRLDRCVALAELRRVRILLVLGLSPQWASSRPAEHSTYHPGNAAPPADLEDWRTYVRTVASRYKGRIHEYEIWNEPNYKDFYTGTTAEMVALTREASNIIKSIDPTSTIVSPSATTAKGVTWLKEFLQAGGGQYVDVIGYHFYVSPHAPEEMVPLIQDVISVLRACHEQKAIWNTESGWGTGGTERKSSMITGLAPAYVARSYVLNWLGGVQRFYWYAWDNHWWVTLQMTSEDGAPTDAARAFQRVHDWMSGNQLLGCEVRNNATWICRLQGGSAMRQIVWNTDGPSSYRPNGPLTASDLQGHSWTVSKAVEIGPSPILLQ